MDSLFSFIASCCDEFVWLRGIENIELYVLPLNKRYDDEKPVMVRRKCCYSVFQLVPITKNLRGIFPKCSTVPFAHGAYGLSRMCGGSYVSHNLCNVSC